MPLFTFHTSYLSSVAQESQVNDDDDSVDDRINKEGKDLTKRRSNNNKMATRSQ